MIVSDLMSCHQPASLLGLLRVHRAANDWTLSVQTPGLIFKRGGHMHV